MRRVPSATWPHPQTRREPLLVSVLLLAVFAAIVVYLLWAVQGINAARERNILRRSVVLASLYAKIIQKDVNDSEKILNALVERFFQESLRLHASEQLQLAQYCAISPRLDTLSVIDTTGACRYATSDRCGEFRHSLKAFQERDQSSNVGYLPQIENLKNQMTFFTPIPRKGPVQGYLVSSFRPEGLSFWLLDFQITGTQAFVVRTDGSILVATTNDSRWNRFPQTYSPLRNAQQGRTGAERAPGVGAFINKEVYVGYSPIPETRWTLLVMQNAADATLEEDYPVLHLTRTAAPFLLLMPLIAWGTLNLYHRQVRKAQLLAFENEKLHLADQAKSDFLAHVSHDLKTPLASLLLGVASLREGAERITPAHLRTSTTLIEQELERLGAKVRNLLDLARFESTSSNEAPHDLCDLHELTAEALERLQPLLHDRPLSASFPREALWVEGNPEQLVMVVVNLLENAHKYAPPRTPIHLWAERGRGHLQLSVRDFGPGVPEGQRERIFEKFYRVPGQQAHGTGLGLALCRAIVQAHDGSIRVEEAPGGGALFHVELPEAVVPTLTEEDH